MHLEPHVKHKLKIQRGKLLYGETPTYCAELLKNNLNFLDHVTCNTIGSIVEVIFYPPKKITDDFLIETVVNILRNSSISFATVALDQFVGSTKKTAAGSLLGGILGLRFGPIGGLAGAILGAGATQLLNWNKLCECRDDGTGKLTITRFKVCENS